MTARLATSWHTMNKLKVETKTAEKKYMREEENSRVSEWMQKQMRKQERMKKRHFFCISWHQRKMDLTVFIVQVADKVRYTVCLLLCA